MEESHGRIDGWDHGDRRSGHPLIVLVWLVMRRGSTGKTGRTEQATHELYAEEEQRRREGTDTAEE